MSAKQAPAGLTVAPEQLAFGEVWEDSCFPWTVTLRNPGPDDVVIEEFVPNCDCHEFDPKSLTIPAGGSGDVRLVLDLSSPGKDVSGVKPRAFEATLVARLAGETQPDKSRSWDITGVVRPAIAIKPAGVNLGRLSDRAPLEPLTRVEIAAHVPVARVEARINTREFGVRVERSEKEPNTFALSVAPSSGLVRGDKTAEIDVTPFGKDGKKLGTRKVPLKATVAGDIQPTTDGVLFGTHDVGAKLAETMTLRSLTGRACTAVEKVTCEGAGLTAEVVPSPVAGTLAVAVRLHVTAAGAFKGRVVASVRCADGAVEETSFDVSAYGIENNKR